MFDYLEGVYFELSFCGPFRLGRKALAVNLSDIAAMGGRSCSFLLSPEGETVHGKELLTAAIIHARPMGSGHGQLNHSQAAQEFHRSRGAIFSD